MKGKRARRVVLIIINLILILTAVVFSWEYTSYLRRQQMQNGLDTFCTTIDSMKQVSDNYLRTEQGYVEDWAKYIDCSHMDHR